MSIGELKLRVQSRLQIMLSLICALLEYPLKDLLKNSEKLVQYLWSRHPPAEQPDIQLKAQEIEESIIAKGKHCKQCGLTLFIKRILI